MNGNLKNNLLQVGFVIAGFSILTACHTVEGTVQGAGQDIKTVTNTVNPPPKAHHYRHHNVKHTKSMSNKNMAEQSSSTQGTSNQTEENKLNTSSNSNQTNTSY